MTLTGDHDVTQEFYTATCSEGHVIIMHEPCDTMVLHEPSVRLPYMIRAALGHRQACHALAGGRHTEPPF